MVEPNFLKKFLNFAFRKPFRRAEKQYTVPDRKYL
jgi:hypothetical protein